MVKLGNDWDRHIGNEFQKPYYIELRAFLKEEYSKHTIFPDMYDIFSAFKETSYSDTKVVIIGQDPYHGVGQAHGMSFSVKPGIDTPPSLKNMYKEIVTELGGFVPDNGYLMPWAKQGVLLLNSVLTVRSGEPNSHRKKGWEQFTTRVIEELNKREEPVAFLLWGANAKEKMELIDTNRHLCLTAAHPSPLSAHNGFFGCGHFKAVNEWLIKQVKTPIDWQIPNIN